jgi:polar amino acid transport system substrate-binding protein
VSRKKGAARMVVLAAVAMLAAACGNAGAPMDPAPVGAVAPPQPADVGGPDQTSSGTTTNNCNALASERPINGTSVMDGSTMAKIKERGKLIAGVDQTTYLFGFRNPTTGTLEGFDIDMVKQVAKAIFGSDDPKYIQFKAIPSSQRVSVLQKHSVDIVVRTYSITCDRLKDIDFSTVYYVSGQRILVPGNSDVARLSDLAGKKVCATKASTSLAKIASDPSKPVPVSVDNWSDCLVMLQQGQVAAVSTDDVILAGMAAQDPTLKIVSDPFTEEDYGIGIPKGEDDMVQFVNAVLEHVRNDGPWQASYQRWIQPRLPGLSPPPPQYK